MRIAPAIHPVLFEVDQCDREITPAAVRNYAGEFFEQATLALMGGTKLMCHPQFDVCPDIQCGPNSFLEVKSIGRSRAAMVYQNRLKKDHDFVLETGARLRYVLWNHTLQCRDIHTLAELRAALANSVASVTIVDHDLFRTLMESTRLQVLCRANDERRRIGYGGADYVNGYRLRLSAFHAGTQPRFTRRDSIRVFGHQTSKFTVYELMDGAAFQGNKQVNIPAK